MNKKIFIGVLMACSTLSAGAVELRQYAGVKLANVVAGTVKVEHIANYDIQEQFGLGIQYGIKLSDFRTELEYSHYLDSELRKTNIDVASDVLFLNGYYELHTNSPFAFYGTVGLGYNRMTVESDHDAAFAYKAGAGMVWDIAHKWNIDMGYRYISFGQFSDDDTDVKVYGHEVSIGIRYFF